jgi:hypothetical protein
MGAAASLCCDALGATPTGGPRVESSYVLEGKRYVVLRVLGEGGYSFVYLVREELSGEQFALKQVAVQTRTARAAAEEEAAWCGQPAYPAAASGLH